MYIYTLLSCQIPELLLAKMEGGGEENDKEKFTKGSGRIIICAWQKKEENELKKRNCLYKVESLFLPFDCH